MDPRLIHFVASQAPAERIALAEQQGWPLEYLHQIEMIALANNIELLGGPATMASGGGGMGGGGMGGGGGGHRGAAAPEWSEEVSVSLEVLWNTTRAKIWSYGGVAAFFLAVPLALYLAKERRGLSWSALAQQALRLPFSE